MNKKSNNFTKKSKNNITNQKYTKDNPHEILKFCYELCSKEYGRKYFNKSGMGNTVFMIFNVLNIYYLMVSYLLIYLLIYY